MLAPPNCELSTCTWRSDLQLVRYGRPLPVMRTLQLSRYVRRQITVSTEDKTPPSRPIVFETPALGTGQTTILEVQTNEFD